MIYLYHIYTYFSYNFNEFAKYFSNWNKSDNSYNIYNKKYSLVLNQNNMSYTVKQVSEVVLKKEFWWEELIISSGKLAPQADGAVSVKYGNTELLVTAVMNRNPDPDKDFLPLTIDYRDGYYAAGKIGGGAYRKREWRPTDMAVLGGRIVDRTLRPMFPKGLVNDIVITITPLSFDRVHDMATLAIFGGSLAIMMAGIPFDGPVAGVRIGFSEKMNNELIANPSIDQFENNGFNLLVSGKKWTLNMIEMDGVEISEDAMKSAFEMSQKAIDELCDIQVEYLEKLSI